MTFDSQMTFIKKDDCNIRMTLTEVAEHLITVNNILTLILA